MNGKVEPALRPSYLEKLSNLDKEKGIHFKNIGELKKLIQKKGKNNL